MGDSIIDTATEQARNAAQTANEVKENAEDTRSALDEMKQKVDVMRYVGDEIKRLKEDFTNIDFSEKFKRIGGIFAIGILGMLMDKKEFDEYKLERADLKVSSKMSQESIDRYNQFDQPKGKNADPLLFCPIPSNIKPVAHNTEKTKEILADHQQNTKIIELLPNKEGDVNKLVEKYEANKARYERVGRAVHLPPMLIAALHFRESSMNFSCYLHNGDKLGKPTTHVPAGIFFKEGQWEEAAIHALGGDVNDANGKPSLKDFNNLRQQLGLNENTTEIAPMLAFAERYNGLGYRYKNLRSAYVYGGTNLLSRGMYVADGKFDPKRLDKGIGVGAFLMGVQAKESNQKIRLAQTDKIWDERSIKNEREMRLA